MGVLGDPLGGPLRVLGVLWGSWGSVEVLRESLGVPWVSLGVPWGALGVLWGSLGGPLERLGDEGMRWDTKMPF